MGLQERSKDWKHQGWYQNYFKTATSHDHAPMRFSCVQDFKIRIFFQNVQTNV